MVAILEQNGISHVHSLQAGHPMNETTQQIKFEKLYLEPENKMLSEVMDNSKSYIVPRFQRDYSWDEKNLEELWQDIEHMLDSRTQHFMGYLVFQSGDGKVFQVIDGQQRLATISLLITAALNHFQAMIAKGDDADNNRQRLEAYKARYLGVLDTVTLERSAKLTLNRHNNQHFGSLTKDMKIPKWRNITETNRKMNRTFAFFQNRLTTYGTSGDKLAGVINGIADGLVFTTITVKNDLNAYLVFETLNARGIRLSAPDLLKNYLLSTMATNARLHDSAFDDFEDRWGKILEQLGESNFTSFLRSHSGMKHKLIDKKALYRELRDRVTRTDQVIPYLEDLTEKAPVYSALQNHLDTFWTEYDDGKYAAVQKHLEILHLFKVKTPLSLLMAAYFRFDAADFIKISKWIAVISIRYNVIGNKSSKEQESIYNRIANTIMCDEDKTDIAEIARRLSPIYPKDDEFQQDFITKTMPSQQSSKKIMFLLRGIEQHLSPANESSASNLTLEHVLPRNPEDHWQAAFGRENYELAIDRLGNMAILSESHNLGQEPFERKRQTLKESGYRINQNIAKYKEWNIESLQEHQKWLADQAKTVWRAGSLEK